MLVDDDDGVAAAVAAMLLLFTHTHEWWSFSMRIQKICYMKSWLFRIVILLAISLGKLLCLSFKPPSISLFTDYIQLHT